MRSDRNGSCDANSRLRAFNVCYRPECPEGGFGVGVGAAAQEQTAGMGRFSRPLTYFFGLCPVVLHGGTNSAKSGRLRAEVSVFAFGLRAAIDESKGAISYRTANPSLVIKKALPGQGLI
jgi:hypothetical protein